MGFVAGRFLVQPVVNVFVNNDPVVTSNKYGCLNSSVHGNEATPGRLWGGHHNSCSPQQQQLQPRQQQHNGPPRRRLFDCHLDESLEGAGDEEERTQPGALGNSSSGSRKVGRQKRSKSTSPTRGGTANQRDIYRNVNPETWKH